MTTPSSAPPDIAVSAPSSAPLPEQTPLPGLFRGLDWLLVGLVLLFAFLASSFVIRNSDFWFHLASGRLLAHGQYVFGVDPFCCTTEHVYWTNHSWLYDLLLFLLHASIGAAGLVVVKAVLLTVLAAVLIHLRLPDGCRAISAGCVALALLASSAQLLLQPICLSYLLLGVLLWLLWRYQHSRRSEEAPTFRDELRRLAWVLGLLVLWVNVDSWYLMGPFVIALFWVGSWFDGRVSCPAWLFPASVVVCVLNPHHLYAYTWPAELSSVAWTSGLRFDPRFESHFLSPWMRGAHVSPAAALSLGQWAFFALILLGMVSFVLVSHKLSGWRVAVWLGLAVVGSWQLGLTPFFAVAAAPITAMNFQQWLHERGRLSWTAALVSRIALLAGCLGLILLTWRGWLHGFHDHGRRIAWGAQPSSSLERAGRQLARWNQEGRLPTGSHIFTMHPEAAHYLAWLAPGQKTFLDHRTPLFRQSARDFEIVCRALDPSLDAAANPAADQKALARIFRTYGVSYALVYDPLPERVLTAQHRLASNRRDWTLLDIDGLAVVHGWNAGNLERHAALAFRANHKAFAETQEDDPEWTAPAQGPADTPHRPGSWMLPGTVVPEPSWESAAAAVCLATHEEEARHPSPQVQRREGAVHVGMLVGLSAPSIDPLGTCAAFGLRQGFTLGPYFPDDAGPSPALLLLAIRAARRALVADPRDGSAYFNLAEAYLALHRRSAGPFQEPTRGVLNQLRILQIVRALEMTLRIQPKQEFCHLLLVDLYAQEQYPDLALEHLREVVRLLHAGPPEARGRAEQDQQKLEKVVEEQRQKLLRSSATAGEDPWRRAQRARELGLPRHALEDILLPSGPHRPGTPAFRLELQLLLILGRLDEARERIEQGRAALQEQASAAEAGHSAESRAGLSLEYDWLLTCVSAADGDYEEAASLLQQEQQQLAVLARTRGETLRRQILTGLVSEIGLNAQSRPFLPEIARRITADKLGEWQVSKLLPLEQADLAEVAALLALEQGKPAAARASFQEALRLLHPGLPRGEREPRRQRARAYLRLLDKADADPPR